LALAGEIKKSIRIVDGDLSLAKAQLRIVRHKFPINTSAIVIDGWHLYLYIEGKWQ
jgi:hypothetical protein